MCFVEFWALLKCFGCCREDEGSEADTSGTPGSAAQMHAAHASKQRTQPSSLQLTRRIREGFPDLPASVPLTFTLTMKACLSELPRERPSFGQILSLFDDVLTEVNEGHYLNSAGRVQVGDPL